MLKFRQDDDGVLVVFYESSDGRQSDVADFWIQPMIDKLGMSRIDAATWQKQFAEILCGSYNKHWFRYVDGGIVHGADQVSEVVKD